ncbi:hypothetical protein CC1G_05563 [Coprinopsis cinerea okayama7|uniref:Uncharacterized protein n=1 Tax=Coprinopsis cinerea (strain Okayama-7 / 130 / ATCC MYA-4618 / FGSC 9003) TaxID=240176 RepID=A8P1F0_COPC7|nr:hypothetical protein CC1G_05563 [Coprinopsis cinerea okayama7\|eukprot:XP_001838082.1 hypothetical protein CC1G_05563 [Coprinopsis cinerea okayama7\
MKLSVASTALAIGLAALTTLKQFRSASAALIPNADTPVFYLVATDPYTENDTFMPLRLFGWTNQSTLTGIGPIAKLYFINDTLVAEDPVNGAASPYLYRPYVDFSVKPGRDDNGDYDASQDDDDCSASSGPLIFIQENRPDGTTLDSPPCAAFGTFFLFSDRMDAQLGAKLQLNNNLTSFYSCGKDRDIYYKMDVSDEPVDCTVPVQLYTLPVV